MESGNATLSFDHVGIVVGDVDAAASATMRILGADRCTRRFDDNVLGVSVRFVRDNAGLVYEMIAPLGEKSPVAHTLQTKTNLLNQLAYRCVSIDVAGAHLRSHGAVPVSRPTPALAFGGARVQFFLTPLGVLMELIEISEMVHDFCEGAPSA